MKKGLPFFILAILLVSCSKEEKNDLVWEKSSGRGEAFFIKATPDSGFIAAGQTDGKPYLVKYSSSRDRISEIKGNYQGTFTSASSEASCLITAGSSDGKLVLSRFDIEGNQLWNLAFDTTCNIEIARLNYTGNGTFTVMGTPAADSLGTGDTGLLFLKFDTAGKISSRKILPGAAYISSAMDFDKAGNIYLGLTRRSGSSKSKATLAKYSSDFNKIWETELFNNPDFSSASLAVKTRDGKVFVAGRTEIPGSAGTLMNSFVVCVDENGKLSGSWGEKKYPEFWNAGDDIEFDHSGKLLMLNRNCMILNVIDAANGTDVGLLRTFSVCVSETTDAFGNDADINYDGNILLTGSLGGNFYMAIKAPLP
ncbi:MAG TPA: WD40 repeat domain-containing protein [Bacteroidales bacterium]|nr:WD40 repeat domain-containing protein [Bacteroidales bacterium]